MPAEKFHYDEQQPILSAQVPLLQKDVHLLLITSSTKIWGSEFLCWLLSFTQDRISDSANRESQPPVSSFTTEAVKFTSQGRAQMNYASQARPTAVLQRGLMDVGNGPDTQEPPDCSWSNPGNGYLASKIIFLFSALHVPADFFKYAVRCGVWHLHNSSLKGTLRFLHYVKAPRKITTGLFSSIALNIMDNFKAISNKP